MITVISCDRVGTTHVRLKTSNNAGVMLAGELVGWGPDGVTLKNGSTYEVRSGTGAYVARLTSSEWPMKRWQYQVGYCSR